ncbi:MAG: S1 RNA-binding domain-containing protein [Ardenticatenales bacterium]|nr:S1 RNA-binding domain-containing protein [Ardenticatenales bacterium]
MAEQDMNQDEAGSEQLNWLEEYEKGLENLYTGQILTGTVMQVRPNEVLIDVGAKSEGVVDNKELERLTEEEYADLREGVEIRVYVLRPESAEGHPVLSIARARMEQDWEFAEQKRAEDAIFDAKVTGANKGGLIVHIGQVRGFVPASQVSSLRRHSGEGDEEYQRRLNNIIGRTLKFKVLEIDRRRNRLILSERAAEREWRRDQKEKLLDNLHEGVIVKGEVSSLADFGAFVDLGGADGLIHLSELSWGRIQHPSEVVKVGDELEVYVLNVDRDRKRIGLSLKRLQPEPWSQFVSTFKVGDEVEAIITKLTNFGAFARVKDHDVEGLIHISELSDAHVDKPGEVVKEGDSVQVRIIRLEPERKRLGLSLRGGEAASEGETSIDFEWPEDAGAER